MYSKTLPPALNPLTTCPNRTERLASDLWDNQAPNSPPYCLPFPHLCIVCVATRNAMRLPGEIWLDASKSPPWPTTNSTIPLMARLDRAWNAATPTPSKVEAAQDLSSSLLYNLHKN